jgi:2-polyprenyl-3-methyl-5-hydroxy-6-metoxy-1,4-benzoquinol methylase
MSEFDYQWNNIPSWWIEYNQQRVSEFLHFTNIQKEWFKDKYCLDAGCGNGRYTYALQQLGARVDSFDISRAAVDKCKLINPNTYISDICDFENLETIDGAYDFVLSWGVIHHMKDSKAGFDCLVNQVKKGGVLHIMVYNQETQKEYIEARKKFKTLLLEDKLIFCRQLAQGSNFHGWWDALNPEYNHGFSVEEMKGLFIDAGFDDIRVITERNININGIKQ